MSEFMSIFCEGYGDSVVSEKDKETKSATVTESAELEVVQEGWGTALARAVHFLAPAGNLSAAGNIARTAIGIISNSKLKTMLGNEKMKKYLLDQCKTILKEEQKRDKSVVAKIPGDPMSLISRWWHNNDEVGFFSKPNFMQQHDDWIDDAIFDLKVGEFTTTFWYDTDHIDAAVVILYSKDKNKCLGRRIPAPTNKELAEIFHAE